MIDTIESEARRNPRFRYVLTGVWPQGKSEMQAVETHRQGPRHQPFD